MLELESNFVQVVDVEGVLGTRPSRIFHNFDGEFQLVPFHGNTRPGAARPQLRYGDHFTLDGERFMLDARRGVRRVSADTPAPVARHADIDGFQPRLSGLSALGFAF